MNPLQTHYEHTTNTSTVITLRAYPTRTHYWVLGNNAYWFWTFDVWFIHPSHKAVCNLFSESWTSCSSFYLFKLTFVSEMFSIPSWHFSAFGFSIHASHVWMILPRKGSLCTCRYILLIAAKSITALTWANWTCKARIAGNDTVQLHWTLSLE